MWQYIKRLRFYLVTVVFVISIAAFLVWRAYGPLGEYKVTMAPAVIAVENIPITDWADVQRVCDQQLIANSRIECQPAGPAMLFERSALTFSRVEIAFYDERNRKHPALTAILSVQQNRYASLDGYKYPWSWQ
jgi:hypothetical protein